MNSFLTDSHAHLHMHPLNKTVDAVLKRAEENNIRRIITIGIDLEDSKNAVAMATKYPNVYATVGVHPHDASKFTYKQLGAFEELVKKPKVLAVGEVGLDYYRNISPKEKQIETFTIMVDLALSAGLPIIIHCRDAAEDTSRILEEMTDGNDHPILFHCFSGEDSLIQWGMARKNVLFSFAGNVTYPKAVQLHDALAKIPAERLLIETDCPYLAPMPFRGKQNEPSYIVHTAKYVADSKKIPFEKLAAQLEKNFSAFFGV